MAEDLNGAVAPLAQGAGAPLGHPIGTRNLPPITVLGKDGLLYIRPGQVAVKNLIHYLGDALINIPPINPLVVVGRRGGNGKVIALISVHIC